MSEGDVRKFADETTIHGLPQLYKASSWPWKLLWSIIMLATFGTIAYGISYVSMDYLNLPPSTAVYRNYVTSLQMPNIAICTPHRINATFADDNGINPDLLEYIYAVFALKNPYELTGINGTAKAELENEYQALAKKLSLKDIADFFDIGGLDCELVLRMASFGGYKVDNICNTLKTIITTYGKCFFLELQTMNISGFSLVQKYSGPSNGLVLMLELFPNLFPKTLYNSYLTNGVILLLGNPNLNHTITPNDDDFVAVPSGVGAFISLESRKGTLLSNCHPRSAGNLTYYPGYTSPACIQECNINATVRVCGCHPVGYNEGSNVPRRHCEPKDAVACLTPLITDSAPNSTQITYENILSRCIKLCHEACHWSSYAHSGKT